MDFLDTNILVYAASALPADRDKARLAHELIERTDHAISLQVLQEFYNAARHPKKLGFDHAEAVAYCRRWRRFTVLEPTLATFDHAHAVCARFQIGYDDAAIIAAARALGCKIVYSEDLSDDQNYAGVRVVNPFKGL